MYLPTLNSGRSSKKCTKSKKKNSLLSKFLHFIIHMCICICIICTISMFTEFLSLQIPHSLALMEQYDLLCIADRENMRVTCVKAELNGYNAGMQATSLNIQQPDLGRVFAIAAYGMLIHIYSVQIIVSRKKSISITRFIYTSDKTPS